MAEIVGTITNLSDFLSKTQVCLSVKPNDPQQQIITDYPLFDKPTSREEFLDAFNVAMQFYEKKDS